MQAIQKTRGLAAAYNNTALTGRNYLACNATVIIQESKSLRTVLESGPLTVEQVRTARGKMMYRYTARTYKYTDAIGFKKILKEMEKEAVRSGLIAPRHRKETLTTYRITHKEEGKKHFAKWYAEHKEEFNRKRKEKRDAQKALKQAMKTLPPNRS